jgi:hypothetical protein
MTIAAWAVLLVAAAEPAPPAPAGAEVYAQLRIRERVILRVPTVPLTDGKRRAPVKWRERNGPNCINAESLAGASVTDEDDVDLLLRGGKRVRAKLESRCPTIDYYSGFYLRPGSDGMICEDRDAIHARSGGKCEIDRFRSLVPDRRK